MTHRLHLLHRHHQTMIELLDQFVDSYFNAIETVGIVIVALISLRLRSVVAFVVLCDFILVYFGQNWLRSLELWGSLGMDYHYTLGIKDTLLALILFSLAASPWLTLAYIVPSLLCWGVWSSYSLLEYTQFLQVYYAWSPLYALCMVGQIYGLSRGDSDAGKRIRRRIAPIDWYRLLRPIHRLAYARITLNPFKIMEST